MDWHRRRNLYGSRDIFSGFTLDTLQGCDQVSDETRQVVIGLVQGQPTDWQGALHDPISESRGLSISSRSGQQGERVILDPVKLRQDLLAKNQLSL